jgi:hypothetical protein
MTLKTRFMRQHPQPILAGREILPLEEGLPRNQNSSKNVLEPVKMVLSSFRFYITIIPHIKSVEKRVRWVGLIKTLYVGNLPWSLTQDELHTLFAPHGRIQSVRIITEKETGRSKGFGFVEIEADDAAQAVATMNGTQVGGRPLIVNEAQSRPVGLPNRS